MLRAHQDQAAQTVLRLVSLLQKKEKKKKKNTRLSHFAFATGFGRDVLQVSIWILVGETVKINKPQRVSMIALNWLMSSDLISTA